MKLEGYSDYEIYPETGQVWSYKSNGFIGAKRKDGYWNVSLYSDDKIRKVLTLHKLIWITVNGEIPKNKEINHLDENKDNNSIFNLSLVTRKENCNWGTRNERCAEANINNPKRAKAVFVLDEGKVTMYFPSTKEAERNGFNHRCVSECCLGKRKTHKGCKLQYVDDYLADWWEQEMEKAVFN